MFIVTIAVMAPKRYGAQTIRTGTINSLKKEENVRLPAGIAPKIQLLLSKLLKTE